MNSIIKLSNPVFSILAWIFRVCSVIGFFILYHEIENTFGSSLILTVILLFLLTISSRNRQLLLENRGVVERKAYFDFIYNDSMIEYGKIAHVETLIRFKNYYQLIITPFTGKYIQKGRANILRITLKDGSINDYYFLVPGRYVDAFANTLLARI